jgi:hypothetical protein
MSLLEKASGGKRSKSSQPKNRTSLFVRAMAASRDKVPEATLLGEPEVAPEAVPVPEAMLEAVLEVVPEAPFLAAENFESVPTPTPSITVLATEPVPAKSILRGSEDLDDLKDKLLAIPPFQDSLLSAWSLLASRLPFQAMALFLPQGDFLSLSALTGFPAGRGDDIPLSIAPSPQDNGALLDDEAKALAAPVLGVNASMPLRAISMRSDSALLGLWLFHDDLFEASSSEDRAKVVELLADASPSFPPLAMVAPSADPIPELLSKLSRFRYATVLRFDLGSTYSDLAAYRSLCSKALVSAFVQASDRILAQTGAALPLGGSFVGALGSSSPCDSELSLFQFVKTLKRSLPFLSADVFPEGSSLSLEPSSEGAAEELSRFLAI